MGYWVTDSEDDKKPKSGGGVMGPCSNYKGASRMTWNWNKMKPWCEINKRSDWRNHVYLNIKFYGKSSTFIAILKVRGPNFFRTIGPCQAWVFQGGGQLAMEEKFYFFITSGGLIVNIEEEIWSLGPELHQMS